MEVGKKKLVLDHLIVQRLDREDEDEDIQSILTFGAKRLFEEGSQQEFNCASFHNFKGFSDTYARFRRRHYEAHRAHRARRRIETQAEGRAREYEI
jgi:hypothetical protein